jgi:uncharacterized protein YndB with AHSA1/START domain
MTQQTQQTQRAVSPVRVSVSVGLDQERCFEVFTDEMLSWWPAGHHIGETPLKEIIIEPFVGGRWYAKHQGGEETDTGVVTAWDAPRWAYHNDLVTHIDVTFTPTDDGRTLVELVHRDLEVYGADAAEMKETFEGPDAWGGMLRIYKDVAEGSRPEAS